MTKQNRKVWNRVASQSILDHLLVLEVTPIAQECNYEIGTISYQAVRCKRTWDHRTQLRKALSAGWLNSGKLSLGIWYLSFLNWENDQFLETTAGVDFPIFKAFSFILSAFLESAFSWTQILDSLLACKGELRNHTAVWQDQMWDSETQGM